MWKAAVIHSAWLMTQVRIATACGNTTDDVISRNLDKHLHK